MRKLKLLLDTNVVIDYLDVREPYYDKARLPMTAGYVGELELWITASQAFPPGAPADSPPARRRGPVRRDGKGFPGNEKAAPRPPPVPKEEASLASGAPCPPAGFPRSTFGDGGLSCRVRNGIGRSPPPRLRSREMLPRVSMDAPGRPFRGALASACARRLRRGESDECDRVE